MIAVYWTVTSGGADGAAKFVVGATGCISLARPSSPISTLYRGASGSATATFIGATGGCACETTGGALGTSGTFCAISGREGSNRSGAVSGGGGVSRASCARHSQLPG